MANYTVTSPSGKKYTISRGGTSSSDSVSDRPSASQSFFRSIEGTKPSTTKTILDALLAASPVTPIKPALEGVRTAMRLPEGAIEPAMATMGGMVGSRIPFPGSTSMGAGAGAGLGRAAVLGRQALTGRGRGARISTEDAQREVLTTQALNTAGGMAVSGGLKAAGAVAKPIGQFIFRNIPDPVMQHVKTRAAQGIDVISKYGKSLDAWKQGVSSAVQKAGQAVSLIRKNPPKPPSERNLYPIAEKAANAFEAVREQISNQYGTAAKQALENPARASLAKAGSRFTQNLRNEGLINPKGKQIPFGPREFTAEEQTLLGIYQDFVHMSPHPTEGLPQAGGTFINYDKAKRLLNRIDEAAGRVTTRNAKRIILEARREITEGLKQSDEALGKAVPAYSQFVGLRDVFEDVFNDPDKAVAALNRSLKENRLGLSDKLKALNELAPNELKFMDDLAGYADELSASELAKKAPQQLETIVKSLGSEKQTEQMLQRMFSQNFTQAEQRELEALEKMTGVKFVEDFKDLAAARLFHSNRPANERLASILGIGGASAGGAIGGIPGGIAGGTAGFMTGSALSTPSVQARLLQKLIPAERMAQGAGQFIRKTSPASNASIVELLTSR